MSLPTNRIKKIKLADATEYEIIPERLQNSGFSASLPTLTADDTLVVQSDMKNSTVCNAGTLSTVAGSSTSGSVLSVRWYNSGINGITTPYDGMKIMIKIPLVGVATAGVILSINGNNADDYHPVAYNVSTVLTTHYAVNSYKIFTYDATAKMTCYKTAGTSTTVTGVWKGEANYDSNNYAYVRQYQHGANAAGTSPKYPILTRYNLTNKNGTYDTAYSRFRTDVTIDTSNGNLDAPTMSENGIALSSRYLPNFVLNISHQTAGNPRQVKFLTVNYATAATYFKMSATSCHDNGTSYQFLEDIIIGCTTGGSVVCNVYKYCQQAVTLDNVARNYGDVFYVIDTTNKKVDFYILCGQWASSQFTRATKIGNTTIAYITQYTGTATYYSSGTKVWASGDSTTYARLSDIPDTSGLMPKSGGTFTGDVDWSGSSQWLKPYLLAFKNADTSSSPTYPYTGFYQWGAEWQVNARDTNNAFVHNLLTINNSTKAATFTGSVSAPSFYASSDRRLKENIKPAELDCGQVIDKLQIKEFNFKSDEEKKVVVGAIAQELQEILPEKYRAELVGGSEDTSYSINEGKLLFIAIGALKEERAKTKELEERLARIEAKLGV